MGHFWVLFFGSFLGHFWSSSSISWIFLEDSTSQLVKVTSFFSRLSERSEAGQRHIAICLRTFGGKGRPKAGAAKRHVMGTIFLMEEKCTSTVYPCSS